jgi:biotin carboxyl carrier protein
MVKKGDLILILDAMKMENLITAPAAGKVVSLPHGEGKKVAKGAVLAVIG